MKEHDQVLSAFLAPSERGVDRSFVEGVRQQVLLEKGLRTARRTAWMKFGGEAAASAVVLFVLMAILRLGRIGSLGNLGEAISPATLALLIFAVWAAVALRPPALTNI